MSRSTYATTRANDERPPISDTAIELVGLLAIAIAVGAVYVGARRTRQERPEGSNDAPEQAGRRRKTSKRS